MTIDEVIVAPARWLVSKPEKAGLWSDNKELRKKAATELCEDLDIPRHVLVGEGDQSIAIDLRSDVSLEVLANLIKGKPSCALVEALAFQYTPMVLGPEGSYANELAIPFLRKPRLKRLAVQKLSAPANRIKEVYFPGSDWTYFKCFCGTSIVDEVVLTIQETLRQQSWFFLRYGDPEWHLRVRFFEPDSAVRNALIAEVLHRIEPFEEEGRVSKVQLDTYIREVDRYGGPATMRICEEYFWQDSITSCELLRIILSDQLDSRRWEVAFLGTHLMLIDFQLTLEQRREFASSLANSMAKDQYFTKGTDVMVGRRFRELRNQLQLIIEGPDDELMVKVKASLAQRRFNTGKIVSDLIERVNAGDTSRPLHSILSSLIHMFINRLLKSAHRKHEAVIYELLSRYYEMELRRHTSDLRRPKSTTPISN